MLLKGVKSVLSLNDKHPINDKDELICVSEDCKVITIAAIIVRKKMDHAKLESYL